MFSMDGTADVDYRPAYIVVEAKSAALLENSVNRWIADGYRPLGGVANSVKGLVQSMEKSERS